MRLNDHISCSLICIHHAFVRVNNTRRDPVSSVRLTIFFRLYGYVCHPMRACCIRATALCTVAPGLSRGAIAARNTQAVDRELARVTRSMSGTRIPSLQILRLHRQRRAADWHGEFIALDYASALA